MNESNQKPNKLCDYQGKYFYNSSMQKWLDDVLMPSTHNEDKSIAAERFIRTLEAKIYKKLDS